jgi:hypothetical protein
MANLKKEVVEILQNWIEYYPAEIVMKSEKFPSGVLRIEHHIMEEYHRNYSFQSYSTADGKSIEVLEVQSDTFAGDEMMRLHVESTETHETIACVIFSTELIFQTKALCGGDEIADSVAQQMSWFGGEESLKWMLDVVKKAIELYKDDDLSQIAKVHLRNALERTREYFRRATLVITRAVGTSRMHGMEMLLYNTITDRLEAAMKSDYLTLKALKTLGFGWNAPLSEVVAKLKLLVPSSNYSLRMGSIGPIAIECNRSSLSSRTYDFSRGLIKAEMPLVNHSDHITLEVALLSPLYTKIATILGAEYLYLHSILRPLDEADRAVLESLRPNDRRFYLQSLGEYQEFFDRLISGAFPLDFAGLQEARGALRAIAIRDERFHLETEETFYKETLALFTQ